MCSFLSLTVQQWLFERSKSLWSLIGRSRGWWFTLCYARWIAKTIVFTLESNRCSLLANDEPRVFRINTVWLEDWRTWKSARNYHDIMHSTIRCINVNGITSLLLINCAPKGSIVSYVGFFFQKLNQLFFSLLLYFALVKSSPWAEILHILHFTQVIT